MVPVYVSLFHSFLQLGGLKMETPLWPTMQENMYTMPTWSYEGWPRGWQNLVWLRATSGYRSLSSQVSLFMYAKLTFLSFGTTLGRPILEFFVPCKRSFSPIGWNLSWSTHHRQISAPSVQGWEVPPKLYFLQLLRRPNYQGMWFICGLSSV